MDVKVAARETARYIDRAALLPPQHPEYGRDHLHDMVREIEEWPLDSRKQVEKAMRWLGWLQCAVVMGGGATLDEMKHINMKA